jgi:hypothetical protein
MVDSHLNPYESPKPGGEQSSTGAGSFLLRRFARVLVMGLCGYGAFAIIGLAYWVILFDDNATLGWALSVGVVGGMIFSTSEIFNAGHGTEAGVLRRVIAALGVFFLAAVVASILSAILQWDPQTYDSDPYGTARCLLFVALFVVAILLVRVAWIDSQHAKVP